MKYPAHYILMPNNLAKDTLIHTSPCGRCSFPFWNNDDFLVGFVPLFFFLAWQGVLTTFLILEVYGFLDSALSLQTRGHTMAIDYTKMTWIIIPTTIWFMSSYFTIEGNNNIIFLAYLFMVLLCFVDLLFTPLNVRKIIYALDTYLFPPLRMYRVGEWLCIIYSFPTISWLLFFWSCMVFSFSLYKDELHVAFTSFISTFFVHSYPLECLLPQATFEYSSIVILTPNFPRLSYGSMDFMSMEFS